MANMSYCRFENTSADLRECYENMDDNPSGMSEGEQKARLRIIKLATQIAEDYGTEVGWSIEEN